LIKKISNYYRSHGARQTLSRVFRRLSEVIEVPERPEDKPLKLTGMYPPEALPIPVKRVKNSSSRPRLTLVLPTVTQEQLYAGAWTALKIFWESAKKHEFRTRIISATSPYSDEGLKKVDFIGSDEVDSIESWQREDGVPCEVEDDEIFIVTAWWTAYAIREVEKTNQVFYLIQDFEPGFYPWSYRYVMALESYGFDYARIYNTGILYDFFQGQGLLTGGEQIAFEPGIDKGLFYPGDKDSWKRTGKATLLLYGRPEVTRNLFELAVLGLERFFEKYPAYEEKIGEIISVGEKHGSITVGGFKIESLGKLSMDGWARLARDSDIGISLMCSPHPSYPPLEMVASGMVVITSRIYNKDMSRICENFLAAEMNVEDLAEVIRESIDRLDDQSLVRKNAELFLAERDWDGNLKEVIDFIGRTRFGAVVEKSAK
jgi:hypothetical protein